MDFIYIKRIIRDKNGDQQELPEVICVNDIHSFRPWRLGINDTFVGSATLLVMKSTDRVTGQKSEKNKEKEDASEVKDNKNLPTILIHEDFSNFIKRMSSRIIVMGDAK